MIEIIRELIREQLGDQEQGNFQVTGTHNQLERIKEDMKKEWIKSGLIINTSGIDAFDSKPFSAVSYEGILIHFVESDYFSIKEIALDYNAQQTGTLVYRGATDDDFKLLPTT